MNYLSFKSAALALSVAVLPSFAMAEIAADIQHPLWYKAPTEKTMEFAKLDNLEGVVVSDGQDGAAGFPAADLMLTDEQIARVKAQGNRV
jgi:ribose transport system substrate-binding protein